MEPFKKDPECPNYLGSDINPEGIAITSKRLEANSKQAT